MRPQALPLRSHRFQKVGKKPELMLVWEPETLEQEPVQQVRTGLGQLPRSTTAPPSISASPPPASWGTLRMLSPGRGHPGPRVGRHQLLWAFLAPASLPWGRPLWGVAGGSACFSKAGFLDFGVLLGI